MKNSEYDEGKAMSEGKEQAIVVHYDTSAPFLGMSKIHLHEYIEILYCTQGKFVACLNGNNYDFSEGDMVIINSRELHGFLCKEKEGAYICIRFLPEILYASSSASFDIKYVMPFVLNNSRHQRVFKKEEIHDTAIPSLIQGIMDEYNNKQHGFTLAMRANLTLIFLWIIRYWHQINAYVSNWSTGDHEMIRRIEAVCEFVNTNYGDDIKVSEMAEMTHLSYSYFSRIFKQYMKKSFSEYLSYVRILNAEKILASTDKTITDVAMECGFSATSYFIKQFKQQKGISPKQYRKKLSD